MTDPSNDSDASLSLSTETETVEQWLAIRKEAGLKIDPETAEVDWCFAQTLDPYGDYPDLPEDCQQVGREYFARSPGSEIWVHFSDLPDATRAALQKYRRPSFGVRGAGGPQLTDDALINPHGGNRGHASGVH